MAAAPEAPRTAEVLIGLLGSPEAEEARYADFMQRVGQAIQHAAQKATWPAVTVELLTATLVHNDAYDSRATSLTAATVASVARYQVFSPKAVDDLSTVLWHRVDRNPNRVRNDSTRARVVQALRHLGARQGLPQAVLDASVASLATEGNVSVRRETVLLIGEHARAQRAGANLAPALSAALENDASAEVRVLAARALRGMGERHGFPQPLSAGLLQSVAADPDPRVRREALAGLIAAGGALPPSAEPLLLQIASADSDERLRLQAVQALRATYVERAPGRAALEQLLARLPRESDGKVRALVAATLHDVDARQPLDSAALEPLVPLVTEDPMPEVRGAIGRLLLGSPAGQDLDGWLNATRDVGLTPARAVSAVAATPRAAQDESPAQRARHALLLAQFARALSAEGPAAVRHEILDGLFALSRAAPLPTEILDLVGRGLVAQSEVELRRRAAAVLLHDGLLARRTSERLVPALDDGDAGLRDFAAFAMVELNAGDGAVLPVLLGLAQDRSAHRNLRLYSLRRLALWKAGGAVLPATAAPGLLALTREADGEVRAQAWNAVRQLKLPANEWRRAAADDDLGIRRMAWWELQALGVAKPLSAKWRDPKERLQLVAVGVLAATALSVIGGAAAFFWRLLLWLRGDRRQQGRMLAAQLLWLLAALAAVTLDAGIVFLAALAHTGFSEKDLLQMDLVFGGILAAYVLLAIFAWQLLPTRSAAPQSTS